MDVNHGMATLRNLQRMRVYAQSSQLAEAADALRDVTRLSPVWFRQDLGIGAFFEEERSRTIQAIITSLRQKSSEDLGIDPEPWIRKYCGADPGYPATSRGEDVK